MKKKVKRGKVEESVDGVSRLKDLLSEFEDFKYENVLNIFEIYHFELPSGEINEEAMKNLQEFCCKESLFNFRLSKSFEAETQDQVNKRMDLTLEMSKIALTRVEEIIFEKSRKFVENNLEVEIPEIILNQLQNEIIRKLENHQKFKNLDEFEFTISADRMKIDGFIELKEKFTFQIFEMNEILIENYQNQIIESNKEKTKNEFMMGYLNKEFNEKYLSSLMNDVDDILELGIPRKPEKEEIEKSFDSSSYSNNLNLLKTVSKGKKFNFNKNKIFQPFSKKKVAKVPSKSRLISLPELINLEDIGIKPKNTIAESLLESLQMNDNIFQKNVCNPINEAVNRVYSHQSSCEKYKFERNENENSFFSFGPKVCNSTLNEEFRKGNKLKKDEPSIQKIQDFNGNSFAMNNESESNVFQSMKKNLILKKVVSTNIQSKMKACIVSRISKYENIISDLLKEENIHKMLIDSEIDFMPCEGILVKIFLESEIYSNYKWILSFLKEFENSMKIIFLIGIADSSASTSKLKNCLNKIIASMLLKSKTKFQIFCISKKEELLKILRNLINSKENKICQISSQILSKKVLLNNNLEAESILKTFGNDPYFLMNLMSQFISEKMNSSKKLNLKNLLIFNISLRNLIK